MAPTGRVNANYEEAARVQALTMWACGRKITDITAVTGIKRSTFYDLLKKATDRGFDRNAAITMAMVEDAPRSGRPKNEAKAEPAEPKPEPEDEVDDN